MNPRVYVLALATFTVGTEGYVIAGVLPEVAHSMHVSVSVCGQLVTVFALVYALGGPPLIGAFRRVPPKSVLIGAMLAFALSNALAACALDYAVLAAARVLAALSAALLAAPAAAAAAALCRPQDMPNAIAVTASGNALALTLGAPIGTLIGGLFGWRGTFLFVTVLALVTALMLAALLPTVPVAPVGTGRAELLRNPAVRWSLLTTFGVFLAAYCTYTYLAPVVERATGMGSQGVAALMIVFGAGALLAGRTIGRILVKVPVARVLCVALSLMALLLAAIAVGTAWHPRTTAAIAAFPVLFCLGAAWCCGGVSQQTRIAALAPAQRSLALGVHFSVQFLGVAVGGAVGGLALSTGGPVAVPTLSALIACVSLLSVRRTVPEPAETPAREAPATIPR
ncbi:MFS transporter [Streptomyces alanosinicus]|uniref:MFS transporter n=1 Tax=Streptomyces alanosinicus TaxID=68171 RepID=A0A918YFC7_9ACTN|nr:MFS transporter [Streptomyces alanosinicus]GHE00899.1 MFS transporter [Streptomyces alanosinicus]